MDKSEAEDIVRTLALQLPPAAVVDNVPVCMFCGAEFSAEELPAKIQILDRHEPGCTWRRAKEYAQTYTS